MVLINLYIDVTCLPLASCAVRLLLPADFAMHASLGDALAELQRS